MYAQSVAMNKKRLYYHLDKIVSYLWVDELRHFEETNIKERSDHIYMSLLFLDEFLDNLEEELKNE
tara:strand:+ start:630 stop:827 length:198 start_codon:yes stop_codon:yes gene_type:complete